MKNKIWLTLLLIIVVIAFSIGIRGYFISTHYKTVAQEDIAADEALFYQAFLTAEGGGAASGTAAGINIVQNAYQYLLSLSCMVLGNFAMSGIYLNVFLQLMAVLVLFFAVRILSNSYIGFVVSMVLATIPAYIRITVKASPLHLKVLLWTAAFLLVSILFRIAGAVVRLLGLDGEFVGAETAKREEPLGMKEILPEDIGMKKTQFIENPLPVPKRKEHREMDYAIEPSPNDDYDITDMTGMDFFDI